MDTAETQNVTDEIRREVSSENDALVCSEWPNASTTTTNKNNIIIITTIVMMQSPSYADGSSPTQEISHLLQDTKVHDRPQPVAMLERIQ